MRTKTLLESKNFLNNQNYILGNREKKKVIAKMIYENFKDLFYKYLSYFYFFVSNFIISLILFLLISGILFLIISPFLGILIGDFSIKKLIFLLPVSIGLFILFKFIKYIKKDYFEGIKIKKIKTFKEYFVMNKITYNLKIKDIFYLLSVGVFISPVIYYIFNYLTIYFPITHSNDLITIIYILVIFILIYPFTKINIYSILFFPFFIIILFLNVIFSIVKSFIFNGINLYKITKIKINTDYGIKFKKLGRKNLESDLYNIKLKKKI